MEWYGNIKSDLTIKENPEVFELDFASEVIGKAKEQGSELYHSISCNSGVDTKDVSDVLRALNLLFCFYKDKKNIVCKLMYSEAYNEDVMKQLMDDIQLTVSFVSGEKIKS